MQKEFSVTSAKTRCPDPFGRAADGGPSALRIVCAACANLGYSTANARSVSIHHAKKLGDVGHQRDYAKSPRESEIKGVLEFLW